MYGSKIEESASRSYQLIIQISTNFCLPTSIYIIEGIYIDNVNFPVGWVGSTKSGVLLMKLITCITKHGSLNPLTQMFYSIFIKKS